METVIIYYSKHGTAEKVAYLIGGSVGHDFRCISLSESPNPDIRAYDRIILGTSIYAGNPGKLMRKFCQKNCELLEQKVIGLYLCCMDQEKEAEQLRNAFPECLHKAAVARLLAGGEFLFDKMNVIERFMTRKVAKVYSSVSHLRHDAIKEFIDKISQKELTPSIDTVNLIID